MLREVKQSIWFGFTIILISPIFAFSQDRDFATLVNDLRTRKPEFAQHQQKLLAERYDLADRPAQGVTRSRGKPVQEGLRVRLSQGMTWDILAAPRHATDLGTDALCRFTAAVQEQRL